ncbi:hypothetical protein [Pseudomonas sp. EYE_354]|uniref:hypothetical protein n=1 Tax=unclassified Pseudomonas TaxID=196821 RepID=UPI00200642C3|nr:hypothetical protein [Pseudomonas sp. EYE_354]MCK6189154.1 hypothetical protein [Pseudomonas sp. EYE_354]
MNELIQGLDGPRTAQQELFYDLEDAAAMMGWSVMELTRIAQSNEAPGEAEALLKVCALLMAQQQKISGYADEVRRQRVTRAEAAC